MEKGLQRRAIGLRYRQRFPPATSPASNMPDPEHENTPPQGNTISPTGSFRQRNKRNGSAGSADFVLPEVGPLMGKESPTAGRKSEDRPGSRDRRERDKEKDRSDKGDAPRRSSENSRRPLPQTFDSNTTIKPMGNASLNHSSSDLLGSTGGSQTRDSPTHEPGMNSRKHSADSVDSLIPPNGESGGWVSYDSEVSPQGPPQRNSADSWRDPNERGRQTNQNYNNSRFSPDRLPFTEDADREEDAAAPSADHGIVRNGSSGSLNKVSPPPVQPQQAPRKRDLPVPGQQQTSQGQQQQTQQSHAHGIYSHQNHPIIPVPKTQHAQIIQSQNWVRRPSSPLAREPVVAAQNSSEEDTESFTPRSPPQVLPDIPNTHQSSSRDYRPPPQPVQRSRPTQQPPPQQPPPQQPLYEAMNHRMAANPQLPMYTGASMATALSSISPSQSVSAVGSPRTRHVQPPGFGSYGSGRKGMYPNLGGMGMGISKIPGLGGSNASLDQQIAVLNATNLSALAQLTPDELRALGFGLNRDTTGGSGQSQQSSKPEAVNGSGRGAGGGGANRQQQQQQQPVPPAQDLHHPRGSADVARLVDTLDEAAGEVVDLQDLQREMEMNLEWPHQHQHQQPSAHRPQHSGGGQSQSQSQGREQQWNAHQREMQKQFHEQQQQLLQQQLNAVLGLSPGGAGSQTSSSQQSQSQIQLPAAYPSSQGGFTAVAPPGHGRTGSGDSARRGMGLVYDEPAQQNMTGNSQQQPPSAVSSSHIVHTRPGAPIPPTPMSGNTAAGTRPAIRGTPYPLTRQGLLPAGSTANGGALRSSEGGWIPIPNTDGYPPSYAELIDLFARHNHGRQPTIRDVLAMQMAALASEPENVEGSVFSKSEAAFPPVGFNPFLPASKVGYSAESARSSPRDPPGEFGGMLRRVPGFGPGGFGGIGARGMRAASSVFGYNDAETEVSRFAKSTTTEGDHDDGVTEDELTDKEPGAHSLVGGLRLNVQQKSQTKEGESMMSNAALEDAMKLAANGNGAAGSGGVNASDIQALYPLLSNLTGHAGGYAMRAPPATIAPGTANDDWVDEQDSDEDLEAEIEMWDEEGVKRHPRFVRDEAKRRRKWEIKFAELVKLFHELDRLTDTPMILFAAPPRPDNANTLIPVGLQAPKPHVAISRSIRRDPAYTAYADAARRSYHTILATPPTPRPPMSYQSISPTSNSPPSQRLGGWSGPGSISSQMAGMDEASRAQMQAALSSLRLLTKVEERREMRRLEEVMKVREEREMVQNMLKALLTSVPGVNGSTGGSQPRGPSSTGISGDESGRENGSMRAASSEPGVTIPVEDTTSSSGSTQKAD